MRYTRLVGDHIPACAEVFAYVFSRPPWSEEWTTETARERLNEIAGSPGFIGIAAIDGDDVAGLVMGTVETRPLGREYYLQEMCVAFHRQGEGIGTGLFAALESTLSRANVRNVLLLTERESRAAAFYAGLGFRASSRMALMTRHVKEATD